MKEGRMMKCRGKYTFGKTDRGRSAIDHILVNGKMEEKFKGMDIDEEGIIIDMSDHNLVRAWFDLKHKTQANWKEKNYETITYYSKEAEDLKEMEEELMKGIYKNTNFNKIMDNMEIAQDRKLKKRKRIRVGRLDDKYIKSAAWMTEAIIISQKIRKICIFVY